MSARPEDVKALAEIIHTVTDRWDEPLDEVHDVPQIVNAILASDHHARRDAEVAAKARAEALRDAAKVWRRFVADGRCPTCQMGRSRETTGMVCQTCGTDYADYRDRP